MPDVHVIEHTVMYVHSTQLNNILRDYMLSSTGKRFKCKPMRYGTGTCNMETLLITVDQLYKEYSDVRHYVAICVEQGVGTVGLARWRYCAVRRLFAGRSGVSTIVLSVIACRV